MAGPVETKVQASTAAAAVSGLALLTLSHYVFKGNVPDVVASWVYILVPGVLTFGAGYWARHTSRPVPERPPDVEPAGFAKPSLTGYSPPEPPVPPQGQASASPPAPEAT